MLDYRKLDPRLGRWGPTERLVRVGYSPPPRHEKVRKWAELLLNRHGVVCRDMLSGEVSAPPWKDLRRAFARLELLGKVRRGFFVQELSGEQYAWPEAVQALREAKLRHPEPDEDAADAASSDEPLILLSAVDPANPFGMLFPLRDEVGEIIKYQRTPLKYLVVQAGRPLMLYERNGNLRVLADMSRGMAERAMRLVMSVLGRMPERGQERLLNVRSWNGHPVDVSPARQLLFALGFVPGTANWQGMVYDGARIPTSREVERATRKMPAVFERRGKEKAPVQYDAEWTVSRSRPVIRPKVREFIEFVERIIPPQCKIVYLPRGFVVRYRGLRCMHPHIQQKQIHLYVSEAAWVPPITIGPKTNLEDAELARNVKERLDRVLRKIDAKLKPRQR
jgi:hypothetical protein